MYNNFGVLYLNDSTNLDQNALHPKRKLRTRVVSRVQEPIKDPVINTHSPLQYLFTNLYPLYNLTLGMLGNNFGRWHEIIFLFFFRKKRVLTFHANCLLRRQFALYVKSRFLQKIKCHQLWSAKLAKRMVKVKQLKPLNLSTQFESN